MKKQKWAVITGIPLMVSRDYNAIKATDLSDIEKEYLQALEILAKLEAEQQAELGTALLVLTEK